MNACYASSNMSNFFWVPAGISAFGIVLNLLLPPINRWVENVHAEAVVNNRKSAMEQEANTMKMVLLNHPNEDDHDSHMSAEGEHYSSVKSFDVSM